MAHRDSGHPASGSLDQALAALRERWPAIRLERDVFERHATERRGAVWTAEDGSLAPNLDSLYLCCACLAGDPEAARIFHAEYVPVLRHAIARIHGGSPVVDETISALLERLLVGPPPRLAQYDGRGSLAAWMKVAATRAALDARRSQGRAHEEPLEVAVPVPASMSPESMLLCRDRGHEIVEGLRRAVAALPVEGRMLLRLHYAEGQSIDAIGELLGVHRATAARRLERVRTAIDEGVQASLVATGVPVAERSSLVSGMREYLEACLSELLARSGD